MIYYLEYHLRPIHIHEHKSFKFEYLHVMNVPNNL